MTSKTAKPIPTTKSSPDPIPETASLQFSLPQMLDLALGTPEVGAVNLNILHNFLHVLLHQVNLRTTKVEYRGEDATRLKNVVTTARTGPSLHLHEYNIIESSGRVKQRIHSTEDVTVKVDVYTEEAKTTQGKNSKGGNPVASAPVSAREKGAKEQGSEVSLDTRDSSIGNGGKKSKGTKRQVGAGGSKGEVETVIFVEPVINGVVPSALGFKKLEDTVRKLQADFGALEELATTPEVIERIKNNSMDPVTDMWHVINITKRLDAVEEGIDKITTMVQDLIKSDKVITLGSNGGGGTVSTSEDVVQKFTAIETRLADLERHFSYGSSAPEEAKPVSSEEKLSTTGETSMYPSDISSEIVVLKTEMAQIRKELIDLSSNFENTAKDGEHVTTKKRPDVPSVEISNPSGTKKDATNVPKNELKSTNAVETASKSEPGTPTEEDGSKTMKQIAEMKTAFVNATEDLLRRVQDLERDVGCLTERLNSAPMAGIDSEGCQGLGDLLNKIQAIQSDMANMNQTASRLLDDKETRETHTNALLEQIELLKTIKADKEDLEDALADKADARAVNRKVSYDQFDATCDDLARGLEDAVSKLSQQEGVWQKALDDVQREIEGKLDKIEISPLKEFVNNKLKTLQEKLKTLSDMRRESEAAGTKKLLRDVQCLSCDKNVVMKIQEGAVFKAEPMPCTRSMKPYLTYELDQIRKQQRRLPHGRNMIQFEAAMQEDAKKSRSQKESDVLARSPREHLCNRYCGGSHTVTTPQQRVMRMGHFLAQWGPEAIQLTEGVVRGTDGHMYRSRGIPRTPEIYGAQNAGDQQRSEVAVVPPQEARVPSISRKRAEDARESMGRSNSSIRASGSASYRKSTPRRSSIVKEQVERPPSSIAAPKVSEVVLEEVGSTEGEEEGADENEGEEYTGVPLESEYEDRTEEVASAPEETTSGIEEVVLQPEVEAPQSA